MWTRRRTRIGTEIHDDDWTILRDGEVVGRTYAENAPRGEGRRWWWGTLTYPSEQGYAATMEEALDCVRRAVGGRHRPEGERRV